MPSLRNPKKDARSKERITKVLPVDCTILSLPLNQTTPHYLGAGDAFGGRTLNISMTGLQIHSDIELDAMTVLDVTVSLDKPPRIVTVRTQVAWARRNTADLYGRWRMGLRIIESRPGEIEILHNYYKQLA
jgi:PilZ domain